ncbi:MAG: outer membrane protein OmpA-like peptidoglycan-associated protein [Neolewinella sp.]|jgi:outer membrane protein OmpA-like peptidoglycan-associated protein
MTKEFPDKLYLRAAKSMPMKYVLPLLLMFLPTGIMQAQPTTSPADQDHIISIFFGGGSYYIDGEQAGKLRDFLDGLGKLEGYEIEVQGHTDDIGNRAYNLRLSDFRARAVKALLLNYPVPEELIDMLPLGEDAPSYNNQTWEGKLSNRRVDVIFKRILF